VRDVGVRDKIAILGWGSLIWCPRELDLASKWHADGPCLPVELARRSGGNRATLVIMPPTYELSHSRVYWARSGFDNRDEARANLCEREGKPKRRFIHYAELAPDGEGAWGPNYKGGGPDDTMGEKVVDWLRNSDHGLDTAIWTGIPPEGFDHSDPNLLKAEVVRWLLYLRRQGEESVRAAREYVEFAPPSISTPIRRAIMDGLQWSERDLPEGLFEGPSRGPACP
jgi:hypothetical protein